MAFKKSPGVSNLPAAMRLTLPFSPCSLQNLPALAKQNCQQTKIILQNRRRTFSSSFCTTYSDNPHHWKQLYLNPWVFSCSIFTPIGTPPVIFRNRLTRLYNSLGYWFQNLNGRQHVLPAISHMPCVFFVQVGWGHKCAPCCLLVQAGFQWHQLLQNMYFFRPTAAIVL